MSFVIIDSETKKPLGATELCEGESRERIKLSPEDVTDREFVTIEEWASIKWPGRKVEIRED